LLGAVVAAAALAAANGFSVAQDVDWTKNIVGFWKVSVHSLLTRRSSPEQGFWSWQWEVLVRVRMHSLQFSLSVSAFTNKIMPCTHG
jgi:hypothetical protein